MFKALLRDCILVKLPPETDELLREQKSGLYIHTLMEQSYNPTRGTVIQMSVNTKHVSLGDEVFFMNHHWQNAKSRAFGSSDDRTRGYEKHEVIAIREDVNVGKGWYMIMPERYIYFIHRGNQLIPINDYIICEPIEKEEVITKSGLIIVDLKKESYKENLSKVFAAPSNRPLEKGDIVHTLRHCDLSAENELNCPSLPKKYFFVEYQDIVAKQIGEELIPLA